MPTLPDLMREADRIAAPDLWSEVEVRARGEPRRGTMFRVLVAAAAIAVALGGLAVAVRVFLSDDHDRRPGTAPSAAEPIPIDPHVTVEIPVGPFPSEIAVGEGAVWAAVNKPEAPESWYVARIDAASNQVTDRIPVYEVADVAAGEGAVWAVGTRSDGGSVVYKIDPAARTVVSTIPLGCGDRCYASQLAVGAGAVWVTASEQYPDFGYVIRIDLETERVTSSVRVPGDPRDLVVAGPDVWVYALTHFGGGGVQGGTLYRLDSAEGRLTATLLQGRIPPLAGVNGPPVLVFGHGYLWTSVELTDDDRASTAGELGVVRIDPATNDVSGEPIPLPRGLLFSPFSTDLGAVWFRASAARRRAPDVFRIDPGTMEIEEVIGTGATVIDGAIDPGSEAMWLTEYERFVTRVDLR